MPYDAMRTNEQIVLKFSLLFFSFFFWRESPQWARVSAFTMSHDHTQRHTTVGRTPLDE